MRPIIEAREINKMYQIGSKSERYLSFRDRLSRPKTWFSRPSTESFCALQDISFDIFPGESVGIIGKNGAGKSTLLKILSRITPPTSGSIKLRGRVASLLEVGTGFHPELTGRENIFFNGAVLGMRKAEIQNKFDEIVDFSGVEQFLDTPLKQYSSGMQLRLAFAVAAHLDSEILLMDEVLAVGDAAFQKKCLGKIDEVSKKDGKTVVIVSHDLSTIGRNTSRCIFLQGGIIEKFEQTPIVTNWYRKRNNESRAYFKGTDIVNRDFNLLSAAVINQKQEIQTGFDVTEAIGIRFQYQIKIPKLAYIHGINVYNALEQNVFDSHDNDSEAVLGRFGQLDIKETTVWIPKNIFAEGTYRVNFVLFSRHPHNVFLLEQDVVNFTVIDNLTGVSARGQYAGPFGGIMRPLCQWENASKTEK